MKRVMLVLSVMAMFSVTARADILRIDPLLLLSADLGVSFQHDINRTTAWMVEHVQYNETVLGNDFNLGYTTLSYKKAFTGHRAYRGLYWRLGAGVIHKHDKGERVSRVGPVAALGYTHKLKRKWSLTGDIGINTASILSLGYHF